MYIKNLRSASHSICLILCSLALFLSCKRDLAARSEAASLTTQRVLTSLTTNLNALSGTPVQPPISQPAVATIAGGPGAATFKLPGSVASDGSNFVWVSDYDKNQVLLVSRVNGQVFATFGSGNAGFQDGNSTTASFNHPEGIALGPNGILYVADLGNNRIRTVDLAQNTVSTFAGNGIAGFADGTANLAKFNQPSGVAVDANGTVYVADYGNNMVRRISPTGGVTRWAGQTAPGSTDATGSLASFNGPAAIAIAPDGKAYVADINNNKIRKIVSGTVSTFAGNSEFHFPSAIATDATGNLYVTEQSNNTVRFITPAAMVTTLVGNGTAGFIDSYGDKARFSEPMGITVDPKGNIYVADRRNQAIRQVSYAPAVKTFVGNGHTGYQEGKGAGAIINEPLAVAMGPDGNLYFSDLNNRIRMVTPDGTTSLIAGSGGSGYVDGAAANAQFNQVTGIVVSWTGQIYVADQNHHRIRRIANGQVSTLAGSGEPIDRDGFGTQAAISQPSALAIGPDNNLYVATNNTGRICRITAAGAVTTVNTLPTNGGVFPFVGGLAIDAAGNQFVTSYSIRPNLPGVGAIYKFAGDHQPAQVMIGGLSSNGQPVQPTHAFESIVIDPSGKFYLAEPTKIESWIPGLAPVVLAGSDISGDLDAPLPDAQFRGLFSIAISPSGFIYGADFFNSRIKVMSKP